MQLPRKLPKKPKRESRWRSQRHLAFVRNHACANCDSMVVVQAAHVRLGSHTGMGQKPDDWRTVSLCHECHIVKQHDIGEKTFWDEYAAKKGCTVEQLIDAYCKDSPVAREIREVRNGTGS